MHRFLATILFSLLLFSAKGQNTLILMKDSTRLNTEVLSIRDNLLLVKEGALSLNLIYAIQFSDSVEVAAKSDVINSLIERGVLVYSNGKRVAYYKDNSEVLDVEKKQEPVKSTEPPSATMDDFAEPLESTLLLGLGLGLDYGGIGGRITFCPGGEKAQLGILVAGGYAFSGPGFNIGLTSRFFPKKNVVPTITAMYGYNAFIFGVPQYDKIYYGPSVGVGVETKSGRQNDAHWHLELILPVRSSSYYNDLEKLKNLGYSFTEPFPVLISVGYHFKL